MGVICVMMSLDDMRHRGVAEFGPFRLLSSERLLLKDGQPVQLGSRALDILIALIERPGEVVAQRELFKRVWPDLVVEEGTLRVHIAALRKALSDDKSGMRYVTNVPGRGYCFVAPVQWSQPAASVPAAETADAARLQRLPSRLSRMFGRAETVATLSALLRSKRFVSIVGPGGMGKTSVAVAVGHAMAGEFENAVCFVDLGLLTDPGHVAGMVASALGCTAPAQNPLSGLTAFLAGRRILIILDSCEHVIEVVAALAERIVETAPQVHLLTTSREALRAGGETVHLLQPLAIPSEAGVTAREALVAPAIQLFMERAAAGGFSRPLTDTEAPIVVSICRRLDGIALAIELAASRVAVYGIEGTAQLLNNRFRLVWRGRRNALPRHQTLQAMLDWSYNLLSDVEKSVLRRLSVFIGAFTLAGAAAVAKDGDPADDGQRIDAAAAVDSLVAKSLICCADSSGGWYRLYDTARTYAHAKLADMGEADACVARHARFHADLLRLHPTPGSIFGQRNVSPYAPHLGNLRAALEWSFSEQGDPAIGTALAAGVAPLFLDLGLLGECRHWVKQGLGALDPDEFGGHREMLLHEALAVSSMFTRGNSEDVRLAIERGLALAEALDDRQHQLDLLAGLSIFLASTGKVADALAAAQRCPAIARQLGAASGIVMSEWILGAAQHLVGDQQAALRHLRLGFELEATSGASPIGVFGNDHRIRALMALARTQWLRGCPDQAMGTAQLALPEAIRSGFPVPICMARIFTNTILLWCGDLDRAASGIDELAMHASKHDLGPYSAAALAQRGELLIAQGCLGTGIKSLRDALQQMRAERYNILLTPFTCALAEGLARAGQLEDALVAIDRALAQAEDMGETLYTGELLRVRGEILLSMFQPDLAEVERVLTDALGWARQHMALSWELRAAMAMARLYSERRQASEAAAIIDQVLGQFREGYGTSDLVSARRFLDDLRT